jgi:hypothetical protein
MQHLLLGAAAVAVLVGLGSLVYGNYYRLYRPKYQPRRSWSAG